MWKSWEWESANCGKERVKITCCFFCYQISLKYLWGNVFQMFWGTEQKVKSEPEEKWKGAGVGVPFSCLRDIHMPDWLDNSWSAVSARANIKQATNTVMCTYLNFLCDSRYCKVITVSVKFNTTKQDQTIQCRVTCQTLTMPLHWKEVYVKVIFIITTSNMNSTLLTFPRIHLKAT